MQLILISLAVGVVAAFIVVSTLKSQLKSVRRQSGASNYVTEGSLNLTVSQDTYLYKRVNRMPRNTNNKK